MDRVDIDAAADAVDVGTDHIHADTSARDAGYGVGRRKARGEDEAMDLRFGQSAQLGFRYEAERDCFCTDKPGIEAAPIITNLDQDMTGARRAS